MKWKKKGGKKAARGDAVVPAVAVHMCCREMNATLGTVGCCTQQSRRECRSSAATRPRGRVDTASLSFLTCKVRIVDTFGPGHLPYALAGAPAIQSSKKANRPRTLDGLRYFG